MRRARGSRRPTAVRGLLGGLIVAPIVLAGSALGPGGPAHASVPDNSDPPDPASAAPLDVLLDVRIADAEGTTSQPVSAPFVVQLRPSSGQGAADEEAITCIFSAGADLAEADSSTTAATTETSTETTTETTTATTESNAADGGNALAGWTCDQPIDMSEELVAELGVVDEDTDDFRALIDQRGEIDRSDDGISVVFRSGRGLVASVPDEIAAGPVAITFPRECGEGAVAGPTGSGSPIVLLIDTDNCPPTEFLTIRLPDGAGYEIDAPEEGIAARGLLDLTTPAIGRGGPVTLGRPGSESVSAQRGLRVAFSIDEQTCGASDINENGAYAVSLHQPCGAAQNATASMLETGLTAAVELGAAPILAVNFEIPEGRRLAMGRAQADDASLPEGTSISVEVAGQGVVCGNANVQLDGAYLVLLGPECSAGGASLRATIPDGRTAAMSLPDDGSPTVNLVFTDVPELPAETTTVPPQREEALLASWQVIVILSAILFITIVALLVKWDAARRRGVAHLIRVAANADSKLSADEIGALADAERDREPSFRLVFELALLAFVTVSLVTLTLGGTLTEQGVLTILSAIVGYAAGRAGSAGGGNS